MEEDAQLQELSDSVETLSIDAPRSEIDGSDTTAMQTKKVTHTSLSSLSRHSRSRKQGTETEQQEFQSGSSIPVEVAVGSSEVIVIPESVELSPRSSTAAVREKHRKFKGRRTVVKSPKSSPHKRYQSPEDRPAPVIDLESYCCSPSKCSSESDSEEELPLFARLKNKKVSRQLWEPSLSNFNTGTSDCAELTPELAAEATGGDVCILDSPTKKKKVSSSECLEADCAWTTGGTDSPIVID